MVPRSRSSGRRRLAFAASCAFTVAIARTAAADPPLVFDGQVPTDGPDHFFVPFDVPAGTKEIEIVHLDQNKSNILDFGLLDQDGYRGWGGGTDENTVVGELAASRAYVAGPIKPGTWQVVVGKAKIVASPATYHIEVTFRTAPTLPPFTDRRPYAPVAARKTGTRYYAGDFHCHSRESTDAQPTIPDMIALAKTNHLEFMEVSDHNTVTQMDQFGAIQDKEPDFLLVPGIEYTTYAGHANAIGATKWVDHKIGQPGVTIDSAADAIAAQGAILSINHPALDIGNLCIGCAWKQPLDASKIHGVEIETGGYDETGGIFTNLAIELWDKLLDQGQHIPAMGGSDDHTLGKANGPGAASPIGHPATLVRANELSVAGILDGIRKGGTVVKLQSMDDPMIELEAAGSKSAAALAWPGDTLGVRSVVLRATITGAKGQSVRFVQNGHPQDPIDVTDDPFVASVVATPPPTGEDRWRAEAVVDGKPRTVTSHIWLKSDPNGATASEDSSGGGGCASTSSSPLPTGAIAAAFAFLAAAVLRRARRVHH